MKPGLERTLVRRLKRAASLLLPLLVFAKLAAQDPNACAKCHAEARTQPLTHMAHALELVEDCAVLREHPLLTTTYGKYSYRIERKGTQSLYSVSDGNATLTMPIRWAMGASSAMGQTYILEKDGQLYESRVSWFRAINGLAPTLGGGNSLPADLQEAAGRLMSRDDKMRCFGCHATDAVKGPELTLDNLKPGVQCAHCHSFTAEHLAGMTPHSNKPALPAGLIAEQSFSAEQAANFCGRCHRTWDEIAAQANPSVANVRFQPYRLTESKCYDPDDARISCLACHDPHVQPIAKSEEYDARCQACHAGGKRGAKSCTTAKANCVTCHMPKIDLPGAHYRFSDHRIRVVRPNEPYPG